LKTSRCVDHKTTHIFQSNTTQIYLIN